MMRHKLCVLALAVGAMVMAASFTVAGFVVNAGWPSPSALFFINPQNLDLSPDAAESALLTAMNTWSADSGSAFRYSYGGRVTDTSVGFDSRNVMVFRNDTSGNAIATTYSWTSGSRLVDADIVFWDGGFTFYTGTSGCAGGVYLEDVATHELGHALGLGHSTDPNATMYPSYSTCSQAFRTLAPDDRAGAQVLYPGPIANTAPSVTIVSPASGASFPQGTAVLFSGSANDAEDGALTLLLTWTSSIDGTIGSGGSFSRVLSVGTHVITASVTDRSGSAASRQVTIAIVAAAGNTSAAFAGIDTTTQGNWKGAYGAQGYTIANDGTSLPSFASVTRVGGAAYTWASSTSDVRALQKATGSGRIASTWYTDFDTRVSITDGAAHRLALYVIDWDHGGRSQRLQMLDAATGAVLDERTVSQFADGAYLTWTVTGSIVIRLRALSGDNAVYSAILFDAAGSSPPPPPPPPPSVDTATASFVREDSTTGGSWKGVYGTSGYTLAADSVSLPSYASVQHLGSQLWTWAADTADARALQRASSGRQASTWYGDSADVDVTLTGGTHDLSMYFLDWDYRDGRSAMIQILDAGTSAVLDTRIISAFSQGRYVTWSVSGHVIIRVTNIGSGNAVYSGVFLDR